MRRHAGLLTGLLVAVGFAACTSDNAQERALSADEQYALAERLFEEREYQDAITALQTFAFNYPQDPRLVEARWLIARAYFEAEDWATAAQEFLNFQRDHPREPRAPEALFLAGQSYQRMSLRPELDQRDTERATNVYDRLLREYPGSAFEEDAQQRRAYLRNKLAEKSYLNGEFYFDNEDYQAAEIYLKDVVRLFPDSDWVPPSYALLAKTYCEWGRSDRAVEMHRVLREQFPDSAAAREVGRDLRPSCRGDLAEDEAPAER